MKNTKPRDTDASSSASPWQWSVLVVRMWREKSSSSDVRCRVLARSSDCGTEVLVVTDSVDDAADAIRDWLRRQASAANP